MSTVSDAPPHYGLSEAEAWVSGYETGASTLAERDAEIARLSALTRPDAARGFPANTCPASRHAQMIGEELFKGETYPLVTHDLHHVGESILATVAALWETRAERDTLRAALAENAELAGALAGLLPGKLCGEVSTTPDNEGVSIWTSFGAIRRARDALSRREGETRDAN